jgi:hypothetical protein
MLQPGVQAIRDREQAGLLTQIPKFGNRARPRCIGVLALETPIVLQFILFR